MAKVLKALAFTVSEILQKYFLKTHVLAYASGFLSFLELQKSLLVSFQGCWTQWQRFETSGTPQIWDTQQHFLKTHFCWESDFLSFLELQKSLLVSFQGDAEHNGKGLKALAFTKSEKPNSILSKHIFA